MDKIAQESASHLTIFPDHENSRVLRDVASRDPDLTKTRDIDFAVVFAQATSAEQFAQHFGEPNTYHPFDFAQDRLRGGDTPDLVIG